MIASILEILSTQGNATVLHLMYGVGTSWNGLLDLLDFSIERGLITKSYLPAMTLGSGIGTMVDIVGSRRNHYIFSITPKGEKFLRLYNQLIQEFLSGEKKLIAYPI